MNVRVRMLLVHEAEGFRERGLAVSLSYMAGMAHGGFAQGRWVTRCLSRSATTGGPTTPGLVGTVDYLDRMRTR